MVVAAMIDDNHPAAAPKAMDVAVKSVVSGALRANAVTPVAVLPSRLQLAEEETGMAARDLRPMAAEDARGLGRRGNQQQRARRQTHERDPHALSLVGEARGH